MLLRLRQGNAPIPPLTARVRLRVIITTEAERRRVLLEGRIEDDTLPPFAELNGQLMVAGGMLETPPTLQNKFTFSAKWELGRMRRDLVAVLYYMPTQQTVLAATVVAPKLP